MKKIFQSPLSLLTLGLFIACGAGEGEPSGSNNGSGGGSNVPLPPPKPPEPGKHIKDLWKEPPGPNCGDGVLDENEACDDGNQDPDDGCHSNCLVINPGYICPDAGQPCKPFARCGDGVVISPEQCDDGNLKAGDGCSTSCKIEVGFDCTGSPSNCKPTICGNNVLEGSETCEDGNTVPGDGCDDRCQVEPGCTADGCTSSCGDGLVLGDEECDDGNRVDGDGCSADCKVEEGYTCEQPTCEAGDANCFMEVPLIHRDFKEDHSDFGNGKNPSHPEENCDGFTPGLVETQLDGDKKPKLASNPPNACIHSPTSFGQWYRSVGANRTIVKRLKLWASKERANSFVNRYGVNGEQWSWRVSNEPTVTVWCAESASEGNCHTGQCADGLWKSCNPTRCEPWNNNQICAVYDSLFVRDGNPLFFPLDDEPAAWPDGRFPAKIPHEVYGANGWPWESPAKQHNFSFTSEATYWFKYEQGMNAKLTFIGDDDVWVFLNGKLAVDLGGIHVPLVGSMELKNGSITLTSPGNQSATHPASAFQLEDGKVYEIKVFHAERKQEGSSFQLNLAGFNTARSECTAICGDGIVGIGEECDEGENNGSGYNRCQTDCTLAGFCGDGIRQENEQCDDNDPAETRTCSGCRYLEIR